MIKVYHEAPKCMFKGVQQKTDGDYALVHLFEADPDYYKLFDPTSRDVILDNSVFELGEAFSNEQFAEWVMRLKPTWYIVPDVLEDAHATVSRFMSFIKAYPNLPGKRIGVIQGKNLDDVVWCYKKIEPHCDKVAFSFDFSWWKNRARYPGITPLPVFSEWHSLMIGRPAMICDLLNRRIINTQKPHHLLGVALPQEMKYYATMQKLYPFWSFIDSVDTSNPVVHGLKGIEYGPDGLHTKVTQKLCELINYIPTVDQANLVYQNIEMFRRFCNG